MKRTEVTVCKIEVKILGILELWFKSGFLRLLPSSLPPVDQNHNRSNNHQNRALSNFESTDPNKDRIDRGTTDDRVLDDKFATFHHSDYDSKSCVTAAFADRPRIPLGRLRAVVSQSFDKQKKNSAD